MQLPEIPEGISNEGLLAVLFLVLLGVVAVVYALAKGWLRVGHNGGSSTKEERAELLAAVVVNATRLGELASDIRSLKDEQAGLRAHLHKFTSTTSGLTIAYLKLAGEPGLAARLDKENPEAIHPR